MADDKLEANAAESNAVDSQVTNDPIPPVRAPVPRKAAKSANPTKPIVEASAKAVRARTEALYQKHLKALRSSKSLKAVVRRWFLEKPTAKAFVMAGIPSNRFDFKLKDWEGELLQPIIANVIARPDGEVEVIELPLDEFFGYHMGLLGLTSVEELLLAASERPYLLGAFAMVWGVGNYAVALKSIADKVVSVLQAQDAERAAKEKAASEAISVEVVTPE